MSIVFLIFLIGNRLNLVVVDGGNVGHGGVVSSAGKDANLSEGLSRRLAWTTKTASFVTSNKVMSFSG